jgi:hypothetical protein
MIFKLSLIGVIIPFITVSWAITVYYPISSLGISISHKLGFPVNQPEWNDRRL